MTIVKIFVIIGLIAYLAGAVGVWLTWLKAYQDETQHVDRLFVVLMLIGFIGLWVIFLLACWYINRRDEILKFIHRLAKK